MFSFEYCEISINTFFTEHSWTTASDKRLDFVSDTIDKSLALELKFWSVAVVVRSYRKYVAINNKKIALIIFQIFQVWRVFKVFKIVILKLFAQLNFPL